MHSLYLLLRASPAALLLILCLQLGTNKAQEEVEDTRKLIMLNFQVPLTAKAGEEVTATLDVETQLRECVVIASYLKSDILIDGGFNYKYTSCLCDYYPKKFFWDFQTNNKSMVITATVDIIRQLGICPQDQAVIPIAANRFFSSRRLTVV
ncbi:prolactin-inducible protein [Phacochoerus africanus]|uniref:prolactin-inducible protein n=1 Tax=Phacochoerus africanus TaxID=41426 RepID=UPI001FDA4078|nr:prolactin-inducible protein [Phacochoerus africanus]